MKRWTVLFACFLLLPFSLAAQVPQSELEFIEKLRNQGYADYALEHVRKLKEQYKTDKNLDLELINSQLALAQQAPEAAKRVELLDESRKALEAFVAANPNHPSVKKARFQIVQVSARQGRAQLRMANSLHPKDPTRGRKFSEARKLLNRAESQLKQQLDSFKDQELKLAKLELGKLAIDKIATYATNPAGAIGIQGVACQRLDDLRDQLELTDPLKWVATAYAGRAHTLNSDKKKANERFDQALVSGGVEAKRLASYFKILDTYSQIEEKSSLDTKVLRAALQQTTAWLGVFGASPSPERYGVWFVEGYIQFNLGVNTKSAALLTQAKANFSKVEQYENDFTGRAVDQKIQLMSLTGTFKVDLKKVLESETVPFEDLYYRTLFEHQKLVEMISKDATVKPEEQEAHEKAKDEKREMIVALLEKAVGRAKGKQVIERNLNQARYMLTYYPSNISNSLFTDALKIRQEKPKEALAKLIKAEKHLEKVVTTGEEFMDTAPRASKAADAVMQSARALDLLIGQYSGLHLQLIDTAVPQAERQDKTREVLDQQKKYDRQRTDLAGKMLKTFPNHAAGELGKYYWVRHLIVTDKDDEALKFPGDMTFYLLGRKRYDQDRHADAVTLLQKVTNEYPDYGMAQYFISTACLKLNKNNEKLPGGKEPRPLALEVLKAYPAPKPDADSSQKLFYSQSKLTYVGLLFEDKKYPEAVQAGKALLNKLGQDGFAIGQNEEENAQRKAAMRMRVTQYLVYVDYYRSKTAYEGSDYKAVLMVLDPLIADLGGEEQTPKKEYVLAKAMNGEASMLNAIMQTAFLSYIQLGQLEKADKIFKLWKKLIKEATGQELNVTRLLKQVIGLMRNQMDLLQKQKDTKTLQTTVENFTTFLNKVSADVEKDIGLARYVALSYESIGRFQNAIDLLDKVIKTKKITDEKDPNFKIFINLKLLRIREYRLKGESDKVKYKTDIDKSYDLINEYLKERPKDLLGAKEEIRVLIAKEYFGQAVNKAYGTVKALKPFLNKPAVRSHYFDVYFDLVRAYYYYSRDEKTAFKERAKALISTANLYVRLEQLLEQQVSDPKERELTKQRFLEFIKGNDDLAVEVEKARGKK